MKTRRHHNNRGHAYLRSGRHVIDVKEMAKRLGLRYQQASDPDIPTGTHPDWETSACAKEAKNPKYRDPDYEPNS